MSQPAAAPDRWLRRAHRAALAALAACAVLAAAGAASETAERAAPPPSGYLMAAVALALVSVLGRGPARRRGAPAARRPYALLASLLAAAALGPLGVALGLGQGLWRAGLLYTVAGLLLALRPPPRFGDPRT